MNSTPSSRQRELEGIHNFREVGAYPLRGGGAVRSGMIYRSGALELMTEEDQRHLADALGISSVLDLRHPDEITGGHGLAGRVVHISIFGETASQEAIIAELNGLYGQGPSPERYLHYLSIAGERFARAFRFLADDASYPTLIHCTAGKDRTGVLVGLVMEVLGASDEDIAAEYGLSDASIDRLVAYLESRGRVLEGTPEEIRARLSTPPERMAGFVRLLRERHGGAEAYLVANGITEHEIARVRGLLRAEPA